MSKYCFCSCEILCNNHTFGILPDLRSSLESMDCLSLLLSKILYYYFQFSSWSRCPFLYLSSSFRHFCHSWGRERLYYVLSWYRYWSDKGFHHTRLHICPSVHVRSRSNPSYSWSDCSWQCGRTSLCWRHHSIELCSGLKFDLTVPVYSSSRHFQCDCVP